MRIFVFFGLFLFVGLLLAWDGAGVAGADPAEDDGVNESACSSQELNCGNVCFWADCVECTICERERCSTDSEGEETCWIEYYECAPCLRWVWHIFGEQPRQYGFYSPGVSQGADLSVLPFSQVNCDEDGSDHGWTGSTGSAGSPANYGVDDSGVTYGTLPSGSLMASYVDYGEFIRRPRLSDYASELLAIPGEAGSPVIQSLVHAGAEDVFQLVVAGGGAGIQYRYWPYNGMVPNKVRVKFRNHNGNFTVDGVGVHAFQVRRVLSGGAVSGRSAVVYRLVNASMMNLTGDAATIAALNQNLDSAGRLSPQEVYDLSTPRVTPTPTAQPVVVGVVLPPVPVITLVAPVQDEVGSVWLYLNQGFPYNLQLRRWVHNGYFEVEVREEWVDLGNVGDVFKVTGLDSLRLVPGVSRVGVGDKVLPLFWNFQVRLTNGDAVGDGSNVVISTVGRGLPVRPLLLSARSRNSGGRMVLTFAEDYQERMEWRVWRHNGGNGAPAGLAWVDLGEQGSGASVVVAPPVGGGPRLYSRDNGLPLFWDFQVRLVSPVGVESAGSNVVVATVWW